MRISLIENILETCVGLLMLALPTLLLTLTGFLGYNIYAHAYLQNSPNWCDWCDMVTIFEGPTKPYKTVKLCREHTAKAVIISEQGKYMQDLGR